MAVPGKKASKHQYLLSPTSMASDEHLPDNCQHCDNEGTKVPVHEYCSYCKEHLCENCFTNHKKHKRFKQDTLSVALSMPKSLQQTTTSTRTTQLDDLTTSCQGDNSKPNEAISTKKATKSLAIVKQKTLTDSQSGQINPRQFSFQGEICVKTSEDSGFHRRCWITGMTLLTPDLLIITDYNQKAVKMVDTRSQSITDQLQLGTQPWDITKITSTELAVTLYRQHVIQFISVASKKLSTERSLKVDGDCNGISYFQGKLVVSISDSAKLQILDMNGTTLTTIDGKAKGIFENPIYVTTNSSSIYVSDYDLKTVTRLNWQGDVIYTYSMTKNRGMSLSDDGTVFVCDKEKNVIDVISGDCSTGKVALQGGTNPHAVCWCGDCSTGKVVLQGGTNPHAVCWCGDCSTGKVVLQGGTNPHAVCWCGDCSTGKVVLQGGTNPHAVCWCGGCSTGKVVLHGGTNPHAVCWCGDCSTGKVVLQGGTNPHAVCWCGGCSTGKVVLQGGTNPHAVCWCGGCSTGKVVLQGGTNPHAVCWCGGCSTGKVVLQGGTNPHAVCWCGGCSTGKVVLQGGTNPHAVCWCGGCSTGKVVLQGGTNPHAVCWCGGCSTGKVVLQGGTNPHAVCWCGGCSTGKVVLQGGTNPHAVCWCGDCSTGKVVLQGGTNPHAVCWCGDCSTGKVVLQGGTNPHAVCWCGETNKLYYSCDPREAKFNDFLHIYKLS